MKQDSTTFSIFAIIVLIGFGFDWFGDITAILVMIGIGFLNLITTIERKLK